MNWYKLAQKIKEDHLGFKKEFNDLVINIEQPAGSDRYGVNPKGKEWRTKMKYDYGFISRAHGADGEGLDVYLGPDKEAKDVYIIKQNDPDTGEFDEEKLMLGFNSPKEAKEAYLDHYDNPKFFGSMRSYSFDAFKNLILSDSSDDDIEWKKKGKQVEG